MGGGIVARAGNSNKTLRILKGTNHTTMCDVSKQVDKAVSRLVPFFNDNLKPDDE